MAQAVKQLRTPSRAVDDVQRSAMWLRAAFGDDDLARAWCRTNGLMITKAQNEGANSAGGFLVSTELADTIVANRERAGIFRRFAQVAPMSSDTKTQPLRVSGVTASWVGEGVALTETQPVLANVNLVVKKLAAMVRASAELEEDAADLAAFLAEEFGNALALAEDAAGFAAMARRLTAVTLASPPICSTARTMPGRSRRRRRTTRSRRSTRPRRDRRRPHDDRRRALLWRLPDKNHIAAPEHDGHGGPIVTARSSAPKRRRTPPVAERTTIVAHSLGDNTNAGAVVGLIGTA